MSESGDLQAPECCPRCGGTFACGAAGPGPCVCTTVALSAELALRLRQQYVGCLCMNCLRELSRGAALGWRVDTSLASHLSDRGVCA